MLQFSSVFKFQKSLVTCKCSINIHVIYKIIFSFKYKKVGHDVVHAF